MAESRLLVISDIHYAGPSERKRGDYRLEGISHPLKRLAIHLWERHVWEGPPFARNPALGHFLAGDHQPDLIVVNGDYSCDSAHIGLADVAARESAHECVNRLRERFAERLRLVMGDHEPGKTSLDGRGGMRLAAYEAATGPVGIPPFWRASLGKLEVIGVTSSLIAFPIFESETLPEERAQWQSLRDAHLGELRSCFSGLAADQRVLLFCHDPSALHFLAEDPVLRPLLGRIEATIIGHIHSRVIYRLSRVIAGFPVIPFAGASVRRMTSTLRRAGCWKHFNVRFCPALGGTKLESGGFLEIKVDEDTGMTKIEEQKL